MNLFNILAIMDEPILDGSQKYDFGNGAIVCLVAVLIVFSVLLVIIAASALVSKLIERFVKEEAKPVAESKQQALLITFSSRISPGTGGR